MKNFSLEIPQRKIPKRVFSKTNYRIVMQLYDISKRTTKDKPRLPVNDFRRRMEEKKIKQPLRFISIKKVLPKIAALW